MDLKQKGDMANVGGFKQLMVSMKWTTAADFDLASVYQKKDGTHGIVYFGDLGNLNNFPYMELSGDEGIGDTVESDGENEEVMRITRLDDMKYVWILCWDYGEVQTGSPARFKESDVTLSVLDDVARAHNVKLDTGDMGNVAIIATIDCTSPIGPKLINTSKTGILKGLKKLEQLLEIINA